MFVFFAQAMERRSSKLSSPLLALKIRVKKLGPDYVRNLKFLVLVHGQDVLSSQAKETGDTKLKEGLNLLELLKNQKLPRGNGPVSEHGGNPRRCLQFSQPKKPTTLHCK